MTLIGALPLANRVPCTASFNRQSLFFLTAVCITQKRAAAHGNAFQACLSCSVFSALTRSLSRFLVPHRRSHLFECIGGRSLLRPLRWPRCATLATTRRAQNSDATNSHLFRAFFLFTRAGIGYGVDVAAFINDYHKYTYYFFAAGLGTY